MRIDHRCEKCHEVLETRTAPRSDGNLVIYVSKCDSIECNRRDPDPLPSPNYGLGVITGIALS